MDEIFTFRGVHEASLLLRRWPRPSELGALGAQMHDVGRAYHMMSVRLRAGRRAQPQAFARLVGPDGSNFLEIARRHDLLYTWLKHGDLLMYAGSHDKLTSAMRDVQQLSGKLGIQVLEGTARRETLALSPEARPWITTARRSTPAKPLATKGTEVRMPASSRRSAAQKSTRSRDAGQ